MNAEFTHRCPTCNSDNIQSVSLAYETGTSDTTGGASTIGGVVPLNGGGASVFGGSTLFQARTASLIAKRVSPPKKKVDQMGCLYGLAKLTAAFLGIIFLLIGIAGGSKSILLLIMAGGCMWVFIEARKAGIKAKKEIDDFNSNVFPKQMADWKSSWLCQKCGWIGRISKPQ